MTGSGTLRPLILGGGIGGLAGAIALRRRGIESTVLERTGRYRAAGAAITLWPNGMHALRSLGLEEAVARRGWRIEASHIRRPDGRVLATTPVSRVSERAGAPTIAIHRADLQRALLDAAPEPPLMGRRCVSIESGEVGATALFADGSARRAELIIGADGLWSLARRFVVGAAPPRRLGYCLWRGVCALEDASLRAGNAFETWSVGMRFGMFQINERDVYWYAGLNDCPRGAFEDVLPLLCRTFGRWHDPIGRALEATRAEHAVRTEIYDRPVARSWHKGRVVLLGDAAHPMTPDLAQGACSAIEDAVTLAAELARAIGDAPGGIDAALRRYERARRARCAAAAAQSRRISRVSQWRSPAACWARNMVTRLTPGRAIARSLGRVVGSGAR